MAFVEILREYPALAMFVTLGLGFIIGKIRVGTFSLGPVASVLIVGVAVGQLDIPLSPQLKPVFFMMFLFSIGYSVGPRFFSSLKGEGLREVIFAVIVSFLCFGCTVIGAIIMKYSVGETVGLFGGSQTCSSVIGVGGEAISKLSVPGIDKEEQIQIIPVCYAVTYIFGTIGTVLILGNFGPMLLGGKSKIMESIANMEHQQSIANGSDDPSVINSHRSVAFRAYSVDNPYFKSPRSVVQTEEFLRRSNIRAFVSRIRYAYSDNVEDVDVNTEISLDDSIVICGHRDMLVHSNPLGQELGDRELLSFPVNKIPIRISSKKGAGITIEQLMSMDFMHGVAISSVRRGGKYSNLSPSLQLRKGDYVTLIGDENSLKRASYHLGMMDRPTYTTDLASFGIAIFIGGLFGALSINIAGVPFGLGTSGGALIAGLLFGWMRTRYPKLGHIPTSVVKFMNQIGLNVFIAVVGIDAGPSFISGLAQVGWPLLVVGALATTCPLLIGLWLGHRVFKFHPVVTLGCCAGTRTCTAALGAVQDALGTSLPAMSYAVTYAVANVLLVIWGSLIVGII